MLATAMTPAATPITMGKSFFGIGPSSLSAGGALCCWTWLWLFVDSLGVGVGAAEVAEVTVGGGGAMVVTAEGAPVVDGCVVVDVAGA
jgi:hypothetical protein